MITIPSNFKNYNSAPSKQLVVVVDIEGLPLISNVQVNRNIEYGDPSISYGGGSAYGDLVPVGYAFGERQQKNFLIVDGLTISQRLEPEQGRGSISTISLKFVDKDSYMTKAVSSGQVISEIMGQQAKIWVGYEPTEWPEDYYVIWRGRVGQVQAGGGIVTMQLVDPNIIRRQQIFYCGQTTLLSGITDVDTTVPVTGNGNFFSKITGPDGNYDGAVRLFIKIDDEFIEYQQTGHESDGYGANQFLHVSRGVNLQDLLGCDPATPSAAAAHDAGATVDGYICLSDHAMNLALKIMLSGWGGPYLSGQTIYSFVTTDDPILASAPTGIVLESNTDAVRDLGVAIGDYITITGASNGGNNVTCQVTGFNDLTNQPNRVITTTKTFTAEDPSSATIAIRSQFDTLPVNAGCGLPGWEVDVETFVYYKNTYLQSPYNAFRFLLNGPEAGKTFIESEILLPLGAYSLTRQGRISVGITKPPIAGLGQSAQIVQASNVIDPQNIQVQRGINNRKYFNEIDWSYDCDETNQPTGQRNAVDAASLGSIGVSSVLPIKSRGARSLLGFLNVVSNRESWIFNRYSMGAILVDIKVQLNIGALIEVGDVVVINDNGGLQIPNFSTGERDFGTQYAEVINRQIDLKSGVVSLTLQTGIGALVNDRYATIAPSSLLTSASSTTRIVIIDSFGSVYPGAEWKKWKPYVGLNVRVHSPDFLNDATVVFTGFDPTNNYAMFIAPALPWVPQTNWVVDLGQYPTNTNANDQVQAKALHAFVDPSVSVVSGSSQTVFTVGAGDAAKFFVGCYVRLHDATYSRDSGLSSNIYVTNVNSTTITVSAALGFVPDASIKCELIGFADGGQAYRLI